MKTDRIIDAMGGTQEGKNEFKLAYRKAFRLGLNVFIISSLFFFMLFFLVIHFSPYTIFDVPARIGFSIMIPLILGCIIGSQSLNYFTRHLKITLPETIAPIIEVKQK